MGTVWSDDKPGRAVFFKVHSTAPSFIVGERDTISSK